MLVMCCAQGVKVVGWIDSFPQWLPQVEISEDHYAMVMETEKVYEEVTALAEKHRKLIWFFSLEYVYDDIKNPQQRDVAEHVVKFNELIRGAGQKFYIKTRLLLVILLLGILCCIPIWQQTTIFTACIIALIAAFQTTPVFFENIFGSGIGTYLSELVAHIFIGCIVVLFCEVKKRTLKSIMESVFQINAPQLDEDKQLLVLKRRRMAFSISLVVGAITAFLIYFVFEKNISQDEMFALSPVWIFFLLFGIFGHLFHMGDIGITLNLRDNTRGVFLGLVVMAGVIASGITLLVMESF